MVSVPAYLVSHFVCFWFSDFICFYSTVFLNADKLSQKHLRNGREKVNFSRRSGSCAF